MSKNAKLLNNNHKNPTLRKKSGTIGQSNVSKQPKNSQSKINNAKGNNKTENQKPKKNENNYYHYIRSIDVTK